MDRATTQITSFQNLDCWKAGRELRIFVRKVTSKFPNHEKFSLTDNMVRASRSVTNNIAEGYGRYHFQENIQACRMSRGSVHELMDQFIICLDEGYITQEEFATAQDLINKCLGLLNGYINYLKRAKEKNVNG